MSKKNKKVIQSKIELKLLKLVKAETGKRKFKKTVKKLAKKLSKKIDHDTKVKIKNKAAKVWKA